MIKEFFVSKIDSYNEVSAFLGTQDNSRVICFRGELGAGKTCLIQNFCKHLQCDDKVSSPTFSIVNEYKYSEGTIYHFDLYRMNDVEEAVDLGIDDYLFSGSYCLIEWPELIADELLDQYVDVVITVEDDNRRKVLISYV